MIRRFSTLANSRTVNIINKAKQPNQQRAEEEYNLGIQAMKREKNAEALAHFENSLVLGKIQSLYMMGVIDVYER